MFAIKKKKLFQRKCVKIAVLQTFVYININVNLMRKSIRIGETRKEKSTK